MKPVYYHLSEYISHAIAGRRNIMALESAGVPLVSRPSEAEAVIIHDDPLNYADILEELAIRPDQSKIAYSVWESEILSGHYADNLAGFDAVWTCSEFSAAAYRPHVPHVAVIPHPIGPARPGPADMARIKRMIGHDPACFYFHTVVDSVNPRKNLKTLLEVFTATFSGNPRVKLAVKQYRVSWDLSTLPGVISIDEYLSDAEMFALHALCDAYVSAHHAEAWGLSMADAMSIGCPVIATGYSGNMEYMTPENSFPVNYELAPVSDEMCELLPTFTPSMRWAEPDPAHLAALMRQLVQTPPTREQRALIRQSMQRFTVKKVGELMRAELAEL